MTKETKKVTRVYTKLKFTESEKNGTLISFVSRNPITGWIRGVRQDSKYPKMICVADRKLASTLSPDVLYNCTLIPMEDKKGYVVIAADPMKFNASLASTYVKNTLYLLEIKFGNKTYRFDPLNGRKSSVCNLDEFLNELKQRSDIKDIGQVIKDAEESAKRLLMLMDYDKYNRKGRKL